MAPQNTFSAILDDTPDDLTYPLLWNSLSACDVARPSHDLSLTARVERQQARVPLQCAYLLSETKASGQRCDEVVVDSINLLAK
jgi:hypothetical protein